MATFDVDLFIIGAGSGGIRTARIAASHGAKVMVAEQDRIGGTCVIRGCVPKKLMVYAGRFGEIFADAPAYGWTAGSASFDWDSFKAYRDAEVTKRESKEREVLERSGVMRA